MANNILNYVKQWTTVKDYVGSNKYNPSASNGLAVSSDYAKIFFTGDGHIISHGVDYTPVFGDSLRENPLGKGLVPESNYSNTDAKFKFLNNKAEWIELSVNELPIAADTTVGADQLNGDKYIYNSKQVYDLFQEKISVLEVMKFKGPFDASNNLANIPADVKNNKCEAGDTYRVTQTGDFAGFHVSPGDLLICVKDNSNEATNIQTSEYWMVVEANIDGIVSHKVNNSVYEVFSSQAGMPAFDIFAPTTAGTDGYILKANGGTETPTWVDPKYFDFLSDANKDAIVTTANVYKNGKIELVDMLDGINFEYIPTYQGENADWWDININGLSKGTTEKLSLGEGLAYESTHTDFNGSISEKILLRPATKSTIGGVIVDNRTSATPNGVDYTFQWGQSTMSVDNVTGMIYLTYENICNALGFEPGDVTAVHAYDIILGDSNDDKVTPDSLNAENPFFTMVSTDAKTNTKAIAGQVQFIGNEALKTFGRINNGALEIALELQTATSSHLGGIKVAKNHVNALDATPQVTGDTLNTLNKYYGVELDNAGKAFVYVPWEDTGNAFSQINVIGGGISGDAEATGSVDINITADAVESTYTLIGGNGINLVADNDAKTITIRQNVWKTVSPDKMGYVPKMVGTTKEMTQQYYILSFTGDEKTPSWNLLPSGAFKDTWRSINVNNVEFLKRDAIDAAGNFIGTTLNFINEDITTADGTRHNHVELYADKDSGNLNIFSTWRDITVGDYTFDDTYKLGFRDSDDLVVDHNTSIADGTEYVSFELSWWNYETQSREIVSL